MWHYKVSYHFAWSCVLLVNHLCSYNRMPSVSSCCNSFFFSARWRRNVVLNISAVRSPSSLFFDTAATMSALSLVRYFPQSSNNLNLIFQKISFFFSSSSWANYSSNNFCKQEWSELPVTACLFQLLLPSLVRPHCSQACPFWPLVPGISETMEAASLALDTELDIWLFPTFHLEFHLL